MQISVLKNKYIAALIIFVFSFLIYLPSLRSDFVWDDVIEIKKNYFKFEKTNLLNRIFPEKTAKKSSGYYRPLTYFTLGYDYKIWDNNPFGFHLTNILLNSIASILVFFLFLLILKQFNMEGKEVIAFSSSLIFIVHPMHVESVSWIAGRTDILCSLFFLAAFISHLKSYEKGYFIIFTCLLFYISLLSKELAFAFPFTAIAFDVIANRKIKKQSLARFAVYIAFFAMYLFLRSRSGTQVAPGFSHEITAVSTGAVTTGAVMYIEYILSIKTLFVTYLFYFYKLLTPFWFSSFISNIPKGSIYFLTSLLSFCLLGYSFLYSYKRKSGFKSFCILWLLLLLGPSSLIAVTQISSTPLAERYLYLPLAPFSLLVVFLLYKLSCIKKYHSASITLFVLILIVLGFFTVTRQSVWHDRVTLWADAAKNTDDSIPLINYGMALIDNNRLDEGIEVLKIGLNTDKKSSSFLRAVALNNLGIAYIKQNKYKEAEKAFFDAIKENRRFHKSYYHLAIIYYANGEKRNSRYMLELSKNYYLKAISLKKNYAMAYLGVAKIYVKFGDLNNARGYAKKAINYGLTSPLYRQAVQILNLN